MLGQQAYGQYKTQGDLDDLETSIQCYRIAMNRTNDDHPEKADIVGNLGLALYARFKDVGDHHDLEEAISLQQRANTLTPDDSADKPSRLSNLAAFIDSRFELEGRSEDLAEAIALETRAAGLIPDSYEHKPLLLSNLASSLQKQFERLGNIDDLESAYTALLSDSSHIFTTPPRLTLLEAYKHDLDLIPRCIWLGNNARGRYAGEELRVVGEVVNSAVTAAISAGEYGLALEWLETGRAVVWSQVLQLQTPLDDLRRLHHLLADNLHHVSKALQFAATSSSSSLLPPMTDARYIPQSLGVQTLSSHAYALEYDKLIAQIRELEGFENFLRPKNLSQLVGACASGPVIVINVHESRSDALILHGGGDVVCVPLPELPFSRATEVQSELWDLLRAKRYLNRSRGEMRDEDGDGRGGRVTAMDPPDMMRKILADLWNWMVKPIMDVVCTLSDSQPSATLPHVTWCPTGPIAFLPLHAAGIYPKHESTSAHSQTIMDVAVSSYTPTLEALLKPRTKVIAGDAEYPKALVVSQPATPNCDPIPNTRTEAEIITSLISRSTHLDDTGGTVQAVLEGMAVHDWVHLACHGVQNRMDPTNSAFALYDGRLTLSMLMSQHLPNADLAVLSACQTATGDETLSEEAVHLAAGMLNVGYKSVVGTMWSISDYIAPEVMRVFYTVMAEQVKAGGELQPAYALHEAMKALRSKPGRTNEFLRWVPFVHFGL
ncbi:CHAT domain-containing protein [Irpex rosettiformis]|uniref:CHAT domain-containing protein n=1 Tax=Irpex rosettiformis TaxID=378272 RepID=A0ACB8TPC5_9APHY|nr:CHAT domain-containing protein [Irpex rosettiformis]